MQIFIAGATGFMGQRLGAELVRRGHHVRGLARPAPGRSSEKKLPAGVEPISGDPLDASTYRGAIAPGSTFVHLVGVAHPSPAKAAQFRTVDLASAQQAVAAARDAGVEHFVYVSVAHPAPVMHAYIAARTEAEETIRASGMNATILRPWYVMGPGRRWPLLILPVYWILNVLPGARASAQRLGLVTVDQMIAALAGAVEHPASGVRIFEVPQIRLSRL